MSVKKRGYKAWVQKISIAAGNSVSVTANVEKEDEWAWTYGYPSLLGLCLVNEGVGSDGSRDVRWD